MSIQKVQEKTGQSVFLKKEDEKILVVARERLFANGVINGILEIDFTQYQDLIEKNKEFLWRSEMETNTNYKQIIPYLIFNYQDKFFLMQRKNNASEVRLQNKYSLGIGGHIREEDLGKSGISDWAKREFEEEVFYDGSLQILPLGLLNDESDFVGQVHTGFIFLLKGNSEKIKIKSEHKQGNLLTLNECSQYYENMENWSKIVFDFLKI